MGGEPLCEDNCFLTLLVIKTVKERLPDTKIYLWTGYHYEKLKESGNSHIIQTLNLIDVIIDGPYIQELRDTTLLMRGSSNQNIIYLKEKNEDEDD